MSTTSTRQDYVNQNDVANEVEHQGKEIKNDGTNHRVHGAVKEVAGKVQAGVEGAMNHPDKEAAGRAKEAAGKMEKTAGHAEQHTGKAIENAGKQSKA